MNLAFSLLFSRRFLPLFLTQCCSAAGDTLFKTAATMLAVYADRTQTAPTGFVPALVWALFMLPYVLFPMLAGQLADKFEKAHLTRGIRVVELAIVGLAALGFLVGSTPVLLIAVFCKGTSSAFFSPVKYAVLPEHLARNERAAGYSLVEAGTFVACLVGTLAGTLLLPMTNGAAATAASLVMIGLAALVSAFAMPAHRPAAPDLRLDLHLLRPLGAMLDLVKGDRIIRLAIFGKALFWLAGTLLLAEIPAMTRDVLGGAPEVVALLFALFSVGLSLGMIGCSRFGGRDGAIRHVWIAGLLVSLFLADMCVASMHVAPTADLLTLSAFVADPGRLRIVADLGALAILAGVFVVPLGVSLQTRPAPEARARIVSIDNAVSSLVMVAGMAAASLAIALDVGLIEIFFGFAALNALACLYLRSALRRPALAV